MMRVNHPPSSPSLNLPVFQKKLPSSPWVFNKQLQPYRDHTPHGTTCFSILEGKDHLKAAKMGSKIFSQRGDPSQYDSEISSDMAGIQTKNWRETKKKRLEI